MWHVRSGQLVEKDDPLCDVYLRHKGRLFSQSLEGAPPPSTTLFSPCQSVVAKLFCDREDRLSGDILVCQNNPFVALSCEPRWELRHEYLLKSQAALRRPTPSPHGSRTPAGHGAIQVTGTPDPGPVFDPDHQVECRPSVLLPPVHSRAAPAVTAKVAPDTGRPCPDPAQTRSRAGPDSARRATPAAGGAAASQPVGFAAATMPARYSASVLAAARAILSSAPAGPAAIGAGGPRRAD